MYCLFKFKLYICTQITTKKFKIMNKQEILENIKNGIKVYWSSLLYVVKFDFEGDLIIKCTDSPMQELFNDSELKNCFTK